MKKLIFHNRVPSPATYFITQTPRGRKKTFSSNKEWRGELELKKVCTMERRVRLMDRGKFYCNEQIFFLKVIKYQWRRIRSLLGPATNMHSITRFKQLYFWQIKFLLTRETNKLRRKIAQSIKRNLFGLRVLQFGVVAVSKKSNRNWHSCTK